MKRRHQVESDHAVELCQPQLGIRLWQVQEAPSPSESLKSSGSNRYDTLADIAIMKARLLKVVAMNTPILSQVKQPWLRGMLD